MENVHDGESVHMKDGQLSYIGRDCYIIPSILGQMYGSQTRILDLSFNSIRSLESLEMFPILEELILDNNDLNDLVSFIPLPHLHTLSLNKNYFLDLETLLKQLTVCYPHLTYLSLHGNPACPDRLSNKKKTDEDYQRYRYFVIHQFPKLKFLDSTPVKTFEKIEAQKISKLKKCAQPTIKIAHATSYDSFLSSPLPSHNTRDGTDKGFNGLGKLRQRCTETQSEDEEEDNTEL